MKYDEYAESLGFRKEGKLYVMEQNGFTLYLKDWQYMVLSIPSFYIPLNKAMDKAELKRMETASLNNAVAGFAFKEKNDTLIVSLADGIKTREKTQNTIKDQIRIVTETLKKDGYGPMVLCPFCGKDAERACFGLDFIPVHPECRESYINKLKEKTKDSGNDKKKAALSLLLAISGAILGLLPALFCALFTYNYFAGLLALSPVLAVAGFFLGKSPSLKKYKITVGLFTAVLVVAFLFFAIPFMAQGKELSLKDYMFSGKWVGFRKAIFGFILAFGGFGGMKFLDKFHVDYGKLLKTFDTDENAE